MPRPRHGRIFCTISETNKNRRRSNPSSKDESTSGANHMVDVNTKITFFFADDKSTLGKFLKDELHFYQNDLSRVRNWMVQSNYH